MNRLALIGVRGLVGQTMLDIIEQRCLPVSHLVLIGRTPEPPLVFGGRTIPVHAIEQIDFTTLDAALNAAGRETSLRWTKTIANAGCLVIDNSSAFRQMPDIPLVVPELNGDSIRLEDRIIANPNCTTIQLALALAPLAEAFGIERIDVASLQAASGAGRTLLDQLQNESGDLPGNVLPSIGEIDEHGRSEEERKIETELPRILGLPDLPVAATATRVPVPNGHGAAVHLRLGMPATASRITSVLQSAPGLRIVDERERPGGPTPTGDAAGQDDVLVGRIRIDPDDPRRLQLWVVADNLRRGAALNAILILERLRSLHGVNATA